MNLKNVFLFGAISMIALSSCEKQVIDDPSNGGGGTVSADVTLIAGSPTEFASVDNANPLNARFYEPKKLAVGNNDILYVLDASSTTYLRKIDQNGVSTVAPYTFGLHYEALDIEMASDANALFVTTRPGRLMKLNLTAPVSTTNPSIIIDRVNRNGRPKDDNAVGSLDVASINGGYGLALTDANTFFIGNHYYKNVNKVNLAIAGNEVTRFVGKSTGGVSAPAWPFADGTGEQATFGEINDMTSDMHGNIYVADPGYCIIRKITPAGQVSTFLTPAPLVSQSYYKNEDGTLTTAKASGLNYVAVSRDGKRLFFATANGALRLALLDQNRVVTIAQFKETINGIAVTPDGKKVYVSSGYAIYEVTNIKF